METQTISIVLLFSALLPIVYLGFAAGNVKRFFNKPTRLQVYSVLRFRWYFLGGGLVVWFAGIVTFYMNPGPTLWIDDLSGILLILFIAVAFYLTGCAMYPVVLDSDFLSLDAAKAKLSPDDPVIGLEINGESRAYPIKWIKQPQLVEDVVGGVPIIVTYCTACRTVNALSIEFERRSMRLISPPHLGDKVMLYDALTGRLIRHTTGEIILGPNKGQMLPTVPVRIVPWITWEINHPESQVFYYEPARRPIVTFTDLFNKLKTIRLIQKEKPIFHPGF